jgi:hypothetical protein
MSDNEFHIIERLIRNLSHEIKNPLTTMKGYAQLLGSRPVDTQLLQKSRNSIIEQIERIDSMLRELYDIFSMKTSKRETFDAAEALRAAVDAMAEKKRIRLGAFENQGAVSLTGEKDLFIQMAKDVVEGFDWEHHPSAAVSVALKPGGKNGILEILFREVDFSDVDPDVFYLPFAMKKYYKKGTELYRAYSISHLHGWKFTAARPHGAGGFIIEF